MKTFLVILTTSLFLISCNKEEPENTCINGIQDNGETGIDCGGTCTPCAIPTSPYVFAKVNDIDVSFKQKDFAFDQLTGLWHMTASNDTISLRITHDSDLSVGSYDFGVNSQVIVNGEEYSLFVNDGFSVAENNASKQAIQGFFSAVFHRNVFNDSIRVKAGVYGDMPY